MDRATSLQQIRQRNTPWDIVVIGGGATGMGIAVDAASRGFAVCLLEQSDFGKGTSSRSTKLIHGGVRYLQQGNVSLVREALKERGILRRNAPHLVHELAFIVPNYAWWEATFYGVGMKVYDMLAFKYGFGKSRHLSRAAVLKHIPTLEPTGLRGGVVYHDGQFDDSRLLINLAQTADEHGAVLFNYAKVTALRLGEGDNAVTFVDLESNQSHTIAARCVINATGAFADEIRKLDDPAAAPMISPSQGVHIVLDRSFLPGDSAIMVPRTSDKRVLFAIPWHGRVLIGTTDTPIEQASLEPVAQEQEIAFILDTASEYLAKRPTRGDILSVFAGVRPLVKSADTGNTAALSRDHTIHLSDTGLITIAGGKWTTYRKMAEDCVDTAIDAARLEARDCVTAELPIHGSCPPFDGELGFYGVDAAKIESLGKQKSISDRLPITPAQIVWSVREEMARTVDDVLARRTRCLLLDAEAAIAIAPAVAKIMAGELGKNSNWAADQVTQFTKLARRYTVQST